MTASSTSRMGMSSRTGYTLRHSAHFRLDPSLFCVSGFLHAGHTRISIRSSGIIQGFYANRRGKWAARACPERNRTGRYPKERAPLSDRKDWFCYNYI